MLPNYDKEQRRVSNFGFFCLQLSLDQRRDHTRVLQHLAREAELLESGSPHFPTLWGLGFRV